MFRWIKSTFVRGSRPRGLTADCLHEFRNHAAGGATLGQKTGDKVPNSVSRADKLDPLWKLMTDRVVAASILTATLPILAVCWLLIRCSSAGPAVTRQQRIGRNGRCFDLLKLRTLVQDVDLRSGSVPAAPSDPQLTRVGVFLRKINLDELPQIWNVLRGDMSLVGPRPERPESAYMLSHYVPGYQRRHAVKPGITGLAQVNLPPEGNLDDVRRKLTLDLEYIRRSSVMLDFRLMVHLGAKMFGCSPAIACRLLGLEQKTDLTLTGEQATEQLKAAG
jgi:lipopolysaccharide/colanic/teichoic acid biosynthesis glycosyltransferase